MDRRRRSFATICVFLLAGLIAAPAWSAWWWPWSKPKSLAWQTDLQAAHKVAVQSNKPLLIVFGASWCGYCKKLERETLGDAALIKFVSDEFVPVHLDFDKERRVVELLGVKSLPTCVVLSPQADILALIVGYSDKTAFRKKLDAALVGSN